MQAEYKIFIDGTAATQEQLDRVDRITVEQEIDVAWEARIHFPVGTEESSGSWDEDFAEGFSRIRIELKIAGMDDFVPLIDGPVIGNERDLDSEPGRSQASVRVQDDSVFLNREDEVESYDQGSDGAIADEVFSRFAEIASTEVETTPDYPDSQPLEVVQRGTAMSFLKELARRNDYFAFVWPGDEAGESVGVFGPLGSQVEDSLPALYLTGDNRNVTRLGGRYDGQRAGRVVADTISLADKSIISAEADPSAVDRIGDEALEGDDVATYRLRPGSGEAVDLQTRVDAEAARRSRSGQMRGTIEGAMLSAVLRPYQSVRLHGSGRQSGDYLIRKVTHSIGRDNYSQEFVLTTNAVASEAGSSGVPSEVF